MTSLTETLPILDQAVPALPGKVEEVAHKADDFHRAAREAVAQFQQRRAEAEALTEQVRQALESFRDAVAQDEQHVAEQARALEQSAEDEAREAGEASEAMHTAAEEAVAAFDRLQAALVQAGDRTDGAQDEARAALDGLGQEARSSEPELEAATGAMVTAVGAAEQAVKEGQDLVTKAITSLKEAMVHVLADAQERLRHTYDRLDQVRADQEKAVEEAMSTLDAEMGRMCQALQHRMDEDVQQAADPDLDAVSSALAEMGQQVSHLRAEAEAGREQLSDQLTAVADRIAPLQGGVQQVKQAAEQVGIAWP